MKKPQTVTDDKGNIYIIPAQMTREEVEVYFPSQPDSSKREDTHTFKRYQPLFDPNDPKSVERAQKALDVAYSDAVLGT